MAKKPRVFVGLSGGVDSATSAALLEQAGYDVTGVFIKIAIPGYPCKAAEDRVEAMRVAAHLRLSFREIDLSREYQERVFEHSLREFARGRTPNPDVLCNREIKFGLFYEYAMAQGADCIATGHYAQVKSSGKAQEKSLVGGVPLFKGAKRLLKNGAKSFSNGAFPELFASPDAEKDQSYFLWMVPQAQLAKTIFPVGDKTKSQVRSLAARFALPNAKRKDSQGLCFLGDIALTDLLMQELKPRPGAVLDERGTVIGAHDGSALYTLGQRHGFSLNSSHPRAQYVIAKNAVHNTLTVASDPHPTVGSRTRIALEEMNWIGAVSSGTCRARYRYRQELLSATVDPDRGVVVIEKPRYIPDGQSLVLYREEAGGLRCLGGGVVLGSKVE